MAAAVRNGQRVVCVTATRGEKGVQDETRWPAERLADIRSQELMDALRILGVKEHHFLEYADGECHKVPLEEGAAIAKQFIADIQPDSILTFASDGMTGHLDHQSVSAWVQAAVKDLAEPPRVFYCAPLRSVYEQYMKELDEQFNIFFNVKEPRLVEPSDCDLCFSCDNELCALKCAALKAMPSQTEALFTVATPSQQRGMLSIESFSSKPA
jgi:LmbE family N-acetylglucosaminyl deacetylase